MNNKEFAERLGWNEKALAARLGALGLLVPCTRCCGTGHHSYCQMYGTTCFKCHGSKKQLPKLTAKLAAQAAELVANGGLVEYLAKVAAKRQAKAELPALIAAAEAQYRRVADVYTAESKAGRIDIAGRLFAFQGQANKLYFGDWDYTQPKWLGARDVKAWAERGDLDVVEAKSIIEQRIQQLRILADEFEAGDIAA